MRIPGVAKASILGKGFGLIAEVHISVGTIVWIPCQSCRRVDSRFLHMFPEEERDYLVELGYYLSDGSILLPCSDFCFINHSCEANILDSLRGFALCVSKVAPGEELTYDYRVFVHEPPWSFDCKCSSKPCIGRISPSPEIPANLLSIWERRLAPALKAVNVVVQPLAYLLDSAGQPRFMMPGPPAGSPS